MVLKSILDPGVEVRSVWLLKGGVCPFSSSIPYDTMRTLCLHEGCLLHPTLDREESSCHYISMSSSQPSRRVLKS